VTEIPSGSEPDSGTDGGEIPVAGRVGRISADLADASCRTPVRVGGEDLGVETFGECQAEAIGE
jgi:hypothetical protein